MLQQILVYFAIALFIGISQSAGIGGGPISSILLMIGLGIQAKESMSITYIFLMGGAFAAMWVNFQKRNPKTGGPLMDYNLIMVTMPMSVSGSIFGTILNHFISELVLTILFTLLLGLLSRDSFKKYQTARNSVRSSVVSPEKIQPLIQMRDMNQNQQKTIDPRLQEILEKQKAVFPIQKIKIIGQIFVYTVIILLCKGGISYNSILGFQSCGFGSWICIIAHLTLSYLYSKSIAMKQYQIDQEKQKMGFVFQNQSQKMSEGKMRSTMMYGFLAGLMGGMLGLGGAIILVPVWLNSGIDKHIATSSSGPLIFFSAIVAYFIGVLSGSYENFPIQIFYFILAYVGAYGVKKLVVYITDKYKLKATIFLLLLITMLTSLAALLPFEILHAIDSPQQFFQFGQLC